MPVAIPKGENAAALADWIETTLAVGSAPTISFVRIDKLLKGEASETAEEELRRGDPLGDDTLSEGEEEEFDLALLGTEAEIERDARSEFLEAEVIRRAELGQNAYPYRVEDERIVKTEACGESVYLLLLALGSADASYRSERRAHEVEAAFDQIALAAMKRYLGRDADGLRFARNSADPDDPNTRPKLFSEAIEWLREKLEVRSGSGRVTDDETEEPHWEWKDGRSSLPPLNSYNDAGVDLVVWWKFQDGRRGFPVLLVQCTVQLQWETKLADISPDLWREWINFSMVPPQRALVIPFGEDPKSAQWEHRSLRAGVVIDRIRLLELLGELDCEELGRLVNSDTKEWTARELATI